ncbi:hypothetical protein RRF57_008473 [Xylaria bambusicola]|uniref:Uncharacterized protein n=1 Tax=Xylaria bambusicola TaxID=326684 RepID=A0AAN7UY40_9PEZI
MALGLLLASYSISGQLNKLVPSMGLHLSLALAKLTAQSLEANQEGDVDDLDNLVRTSASNERQEPSHVDAVVYRSLS